MPDLLTIRDLGKRYGEVVALDEISLGIPEGGSLAVVGESGSGKTTLGRLVVGLERPTTGSVRFGGDELAPGSRTRAQRRAIQLVPQDPLSTLNPSKTAGASVALPLVVHGLPHGRARLAELFDTVGLPASFIDRFPAELSGGQRQRVAIARALATEPRLIVLDEPTAALDVLMQARVVRLLERLRRNFGVAYLFITHDLALVSSVASRIAVLYRGRLVELGPAGSVFQSPRHRYTERLLSTVAVVDDAEERLKPQWPENAPDDRETVSPGCLFRPRCPYAVAACDEQPPLSGEGDHRHACVAPAAGSSDQ